MDHNIWEIVSVFLLSTIKFVFGSVPMALSFGFSFFETIFITSIGGFVGVLVFVNLSDFMLKRFKKLQEKKRADKHIEKPIKKFTRKNKLIVKIKRNFGLTGIALATPLLLSIPLGCFLAVRYFKEKQTIIPYMFGSILFWSFSTAFLFKPLINAIRTYFL